MTARFQCPLCLDIVQRLFKMQGRPPHCSGWNVGRYNVAILWHFFCSPWGLDPVNGRFGRNHPTCGNNNRTNSPYQGLSAIIVWLVECQGIQDFSHARAVISDPSPLSLTHISLVRAVGRGSFRGTMSEVLGSFLTSWKGNGGQKKEDPGTKYVLKGGTVYTVYTLGDKASIPTTWHSVCKYKLCKQKRLT